MVMKKSFSMIELILAIVIMSLSLVAIPTIIFQTAQSNAYALQQEALLQSKMQIGIVFSTPWDSNTFDGNSAYSRIIRTDSKAQGLEIPQNFFKGAEFADICFDENGSFLSKCETKLRKSIPLEKWAYYGNIGKLQKAENNKQKGINDYDGYNKNLSTDQNIAGGSLDVLLNTNATFSVSYIDDKPLGENSTNNYVKSKNVKFIFSSEKIPSTSNIKMIEISTKINDASEPNIILRTYSSNILVPVTYTRILKGN